MSDFKEPAIVVNGQTLTTAEAMTIRVAVGAFFMQLDRDGLGDDSSGKAICEGYEAACRAIFRRMKRD